MDEDCAKISSMFTGIAFADISAVDALAQARTPFDVRFFTLATDLGGAFIVIAVCLIAVIFLWKGKRWEYAVGLLVSLVASLLVSSLLKLIVARQRPPLPLHAIVESDYSFPSNHAAAAMALYGFLIFVLWHLHSKWKIPWAILFSLIIGLVGFSRVYLGVHYPSDVIAGYLIGYIFAWIGAKCTRKLERLTNRAVKR